jgi:serine protease Do
MALKPLLLLGALLLSGTAFAQSPEAPISSTAERLYATARPRLLQIRTLVSAAGRQSALGSGFLVSADGLAITNYHVVSHAALEPKTYRLEYAAADGARGALTLLAIDLANDLAVVRLDRSDVPFFAFDPRATDGELAKGERLYSMGNPLDLGFTIHFTGALNPGMSGGPAVSAEGAIIGVNVAKQFGGDLVSFLVPGRFAATLVRRAQEHPAPAGMDWHAEIGAQLAHWQAGLYEATSARGFRPVALGPYETVESAAPWFNCWAHTNAGQVPKPRASADITTCNSETRVFVADDLVTGNIRLVNAYFRALELNQFQFAAFVSQQSQPPWPGSGDKKWRTPQRCHEDFLATAADGKHPALRAVWCARAYREFAGLYDVTVTALTQDSGREALVSRLSLQGTSYDNAVNIAKRFLEAVQWTK